MKLMILPLMAATQLALAAAASPDTSFYRTAAEGGMSEVELANLAQEKSSDPKVKDFAAMMVKDHTAANQKLQAVASSKDVTLPASTSTAQKATKAKLEVLSGESFDKSYVKSQVKAHEDTLQALKKEISSGKDADAKAFAESMLPTVQHHLQAVRSLAAAEGAKVAGR